MPKTVSGSGSWRLGSFSISGSGGVPVPDPGPNTRGLIAGIEIKFSGTYFDEVGGEKMAQVDWSAAGFKFSEVPGDGQSAGGQSNRFWMRRAQRIESLSSINLDMYSYLSIDGGMGFGQDQLGLGIITKKITFFIIRNRPGGSPLLIGGASKAPWTALLQGQMTIPPGYEAIFATQNVSGWGVQRGTSQYLQLLSTGGASVVDIYIGGRYF